MERVAEAATAPSWASSGVFHCWPPQGSFYELWRRLGGHTPTGSRANTLQLAWENPLNQGTNKNKEEENPDKNLDGVPPRKIGPQWQECCLRRPEDKAEPSTLDNIPCNPGSWWSARNPPSVPDMDRLRTSSGSNSQQPIWSQLCSGSRGHLTSATRCLQQ